LKKTEIKEMHQKFNNSQNENKKLVKELNILQSKCRGLPSMEQYEQIKSDLENSRLDMRNLSAFNEKLKSEILELNTKEL
jgi:hypothetical protein